VLAHRPIEQYLSAFTVDEVDGSCSVAPDIVAGRLKELRLLDVREPEEREHEHGMLPGSRPIDAAQWGVGPLDHGSPATVLVCDDGSRSSRLSATMGAEGRLIPFMKGGVRRWAQLGFRVEYADVSAERWGRNELFRVFMALSRAPAGNVASIFRSLAAANQVRYDKPTQRQLLLLREAIVEVGLRVGMHATRPETLLFEFDRRFPAPRGPRVRPVLGIGGTTPGSPAPIPRPRWR